VSAGRCSGSPPCCSAAAAVPGASLLLARSTAAAITPMGMSVSRNLRREELHQQAGEGGGHSEPAGSGQLAGLPVRGCRAQPQRTSWPGWLLLLPPVRRWPSPLPHPASRGLRRDRQGPQAASTASEGSNSGAAAAEEPSRSRAPARGPLFALPAVVWEHRSKSSEPEGWPEALHDPPGNGRSLLWARERNMAAAVE
jgi:hypothetical protein